MCRQVILLPTCHSNSLPHNTPTTDRNGAKWGDNVKQDKYYQTAKNSLKMSNMSNQEITLTNGDKVLKSNYVKLKALDLIEFGYKGVTEQEVSIEVDKILNGGANLTIIGHFCKGDINPQP